jgi:hypothetical protein
MNDAAPPLFYVTTPNGRLRSITLAYGLLLFVWLSPEDNSVWPVATLGVGLAILSLVWFIRRRLGGSAFPAHYVPIGAALLGGIAGLGGALSSAGLMFFKNALHAHAFWDYPPAMVVAMLSRAPSWAVAGGLAGVGIGFLWVWWRVRIML